MCTVNMLLLLCNRLFNCSVGFYAAALASGSKFLSWMCVLVNIFEKLIGCVFSLVQRQCFFKGCSEAGKSTCQNVTSILDSVLRFYENVCPQRNTIVCAGYYLSYADVQIDNILKLNIKMCYCIHLSGQKQEQKTFIVGLEQSWIEQ